MNLISYGTKYLKYLLKLLQNTSLSKKIRTTHGIKTDKPYKHHALFYRYKEIQYLKSHTQSYNFNDLLNKYTTQYPDNLITQSQTISDFSTIVKQEFSHIKLALNTYYQQETQKEIQQKIEDRNQTFFSCSKKFFKNILERYNSIHIDRLLSNNTLLTEEDQIKQAIHTHFSKYFNEKPLKQFQPNSEYYQLYKPHSELETYFQNLFSKISEEK